MQEGLLSATDQAESEPRTLTGGSGDPAPGRSIVLLRRVTVAASLAAMALAALALAGWATGNLRLASVRGDFIPMAPNTAACFLLLGAALLGRSSRPGFPRAVAFAVAAVAAHALVVESVESGGPGGGAGGRLGPFPLGVMSPVTAAAFLVAGAALFAQTLPRGRPLAGPGALCVCAVGLVTTLGYAYGTPLLYEGSVIPLALSTGASFLAVGAALLARLGPAGWPVRALVGPAPSARMMRVFVPAVVLLIVAQGWLAILIARGPLENPAVFAATLAAVTVAGAAFVVARISRRTGRAIERTGESRLLAEQRRARLDERDRFFMLSMDLVCVAGFDGYFKQVNPAWERVLGWEPEELLARPWLEFVHDDDREATVAAGKRQVEQGLPVLRFENRYRARDGTWRWLQWVSVPDRAEATIYATARDVTEVKRAEEEIRRMAAEAVSRNAQLDAANRELEAFSYSVAHDLRAPLRAVNGFSQVLLEDHGGALPDAARALLDRIRDAARRMGQLIDDLLALSRLARAELHLSRVDLSAMATDVVGELRRADARRAVDVAIAPDVVVRGDARLLRVAVGNLLGNAWKFTANRDDAKIEFAPASEGAESGFLVRDNGAGFDMRFADKLFTPFQRLHDETSFPGTGIGLATVQRIVQRHGGRVRAEGAPDAGATFVVLLPPGEEAP